MTLANEKAVVRRCQQGEIPAFEELYRHYEAPMLFLAFRLTGNRADAEDALQNAFVNLYRKVGQYRFQSAFSTWFHRIVVNACYNKLQDGKRRSQVPLEKAATISREDPTELSLQLQHAIDSLPPRMKTCFVLFAVEGFKQQEVAEILETREGTVKAQVFAAKARLREQLGENWRGRKTDEL
ncbi:MAG: sigma-70 family RNA polymerase sigma factor [bacterium]